VPVSSYPVQTVRSGVGQSFPAAERFLRRRAYLEGRRT
jgi:hypothetical protein